jgi:predicted branched-subunit amino acid permease
MAATDSADDDPASYRRWFLRGALAAFGLPALILASAFVGFAGLAREAGLSLIQTLFMTAFVWALPAKVVLIGAIMAGNSLAAATFAVALSSVRLTPMVVALMPEMRTPRTRTWVLYLLAHFVAVTSWVMALEGLGGTLVASNMLVVVAVYLLAGSLPPALSAALLLLTPMYFLTSLWSSARERAGHYAMVFGLLLGPLFHVILPGFDLLAAGMIGGVAAYLLHRRTRAPR